ncbi:MAG: hypothetical protein R3E18_01315 [Sphingomonadaceae bacterium]
MHLRFGIALAGLVLSAPANAESDLEQGFSGALRGCEEWVLNPASWADGIEPFLATVGLGDKMGLVKSVDPAALPPADMRVANHYWRINSTEDAGYILVVSDRLPMCHITGGGGTDLQPSIEAVMTGAEFNARWEKLDETTSDGMISTTLRSREEPAFAMLISRAETSGQRLDRVQVIATAYFDFD